jgi:CHAT domain-containing protein
MLDWISLPWGAPELIVLAGFHTAAENGLRTRSSGDELLLASLAMMSAGSRTVLLSRWRTGGQSSLELVREFLAQLPHESPAAAWQRSVQLIRSSQIDPELEPRIKGASESELPTGEHPFFWAGFQLLDLGQK